MIIGAQNDGHKMRLHCDQAYNPWDGVFGKKSSSVAGSITGDKKVSGVTTVDTVVVGSGISGATAAYYLHNKGIDVLLTEAKEQVGGNLISRKGTENSCRYFFSVYSIREQFTLMWTW